MKLCNLAVLAVVLCGCGRPVVTAPPSVPLASAKAQQWEYKVVTVENYEHRVDISLEPLPESIQPNRIQAKGNPGLFRIEKGESESPFGPNPQGKTLAQLGADGWELVSAVPQIETIPDAEIAGELDDSGKPVHKQYSNVRTGTVILIFKRPQ